MDIKILIRYLEVLLIVLKEQYLQLNINVLILQIWYFLFLLLFNTFLSKFLFSPNCSQPIFLNCSVSICSDTLGTKNCDTNSIINQDYYYNSTSSEICLKTNLIFNSIKDSKWKVYQIRINYQFKSFGICGTTSASSFVVIPSNPSMIHYSSTLCL